MTHFSAAAPPRALHGHLPATTTLPPVICSVISHSAMVELVPAFMNFGRCCRLGTQIQKGRFRMGAGWWCATLRM